MNGYNEQGEKHGPWTEHYPNGNLEYNVSYFNGKHDGLYEHYDTNGLLRFQTFYRNDNK